MSTAADAKAKAVKAFWKNLRTYSMRRERSSPVVFAGRDEEIKALTGSLQTVASPEAPVGMTTIIQGVPGAGKTALGREFIHRTQGSVVEADDPVRPGKKKKRVVVCVEASTAQLAAPAKGLAQHIHKRILSVRSQFTQGVEKAKGQLRAQTQRFGDAFSLFVNIKTNAETVIAENDLSSESPMSQCLDSYADLWGDDLIIVLLVDEMQGCPISARSRDALETLHLNLHQCRILPVLIGLPDTEYIVTERDPVKGLGLSRLGDVNAVQTIGCLNPAQGNEPSESRQAINGTLKSLGLDWQDPIWRDILLDAGCDQNKWTQWRAALVEQLEEDSADFPQHITAGLIATCSALLDPQNRLNFNQALRDDIACRQQESKHHYYSSRLAGSTEPYALAFGALCELEAEGHSVDEHEVMTALGVCKGRSAIASHPKSPSTLTVLHTALSKGILQKYGKAFCFNETPPLSSHLRNQYQQDLDAADPTAEALREALEPDGGWTGGGGGPK